MIGQKVILGYWNIRGLGQRCRLILNYVGLPYQQVRYQNTSRDDWFVKKKIELKDKNPAINLPYLIDGDKVVSESEGVITYAILKTGKGELLGRNLDEQVWVATTMGVFRDLYRNYTVDLIYNEKSLEETQPKVFDSMRVHLKKLNDILGNKDYLCGGITYVDFIVAETFQHLCLLQPSFAIQFQPLLKHQQRIWNLPEIKAYVESNRFSQRPVNYAPYAKWV